MRQLLWADPMNVQNFTGSQFAKHQFYAVAMVTFVNIAIPMFLFLFKGDIYHYSATIFWVFVEFFSLIVPLAGIVFLWKRLGVQPRLYGMAFPLRVNRDLLALSAVCALLLLLAYWPASKIAWRFISHDVSAANNYAYTVLLENDVFRIPIIGFLSLQAGIFESIVFIGWPWILFAKFLRTSIGVVAFVLLSSIFFSVSHYGNGVPEVVATFFFGLMAASLYLKIRDLWPIVFGHTIVNLIVLI